MHDGRRQYGASFDYGAIVGKNLNQLLIRSLDRDHALLRNFGIKFVNFQFIFRYFVVNQLSSLLQTIFEFSHALIIGLIDG